MKKILMGIQGTGNGHISRGRLIAKEFKKHKDVQVDYLFSGRHPDKFFDMEVFGDYQTKKGLTFSIDKGKVNLFNTVIKNDYKTLFKDIKSLDLSEYDFVISDYEPIVAHAAKLQNKHCIGIGHQYAFNYKIPMSHSNFITKKIMTNFAPANLNIGLHWHHFGNLGIYPPIIDTLLQNKKIIENKILVYLAFEDQTEIEKILLELPQYKFHIYGLSNTNYKYKNLRYYQPSVKQFLSDLKSCNAVICNTGFELISEALHLRKNILTKPVEGQMEQHSNAAALIRLNLAYVKDTITAEYISDWMQFYNEELEVEYPNVAKHLVDSLLKDPYTLPSASIWHQGNIVY
jgi:uncharacterized protein (TIGR00661 family)